MSSVLDQIADLVLRESGVLTKPTRRNALRAAIARTARGTDPITFLRLAADPAAGCALRARLVEQITARETSFAGDHGQLGMVDWALLHEAALAGGSRTIRVWSTACATGEEVYSLALLACEAFSTDTPPVRILGTDMSSAALDRARDGSYAPRAARSLDAKLRARYFDERVGRLIVGARLRAVVDFAHHNLIRDPIPPPGEGPFHLILCRNILACFEPDTAGRVVASLEAVLEKDGVLVLGTPQGGARTSALSRNV